jgi:hypothetical protein
MPDIKVKPGDSIGSLAAANGLFPEALWNDEKNTKLKEDRKTGNVLKPGDFVHIPEMVKKQEVCSADQKHKFRRLGIPVKLQIKLLDMHHDPIANKAYTLQIDGSYPAEKPDQNFSTDDSGLVEEWIPVDAKVVKLTLSKSGREYVFKVGHLDPIDTDQGVQHRLHNLGYKCAEEFGNIGPKTNLAVINYRQFHGMEGPMDVIDADFRKHLTDTFGG